MSAWTTSVPTSPGWYWVYGKDGIYMLNVRLGVLGLYIESIGQDILYAIEEYGITHWLGPLPEPDLPT